MCLDKTTILCRKKEHDSKSIRSFMCFIRLFYLSNIHFTIYLRFHNIVIALYKLLLLFHKTHQNQTMSCTAFDTERWTLFMVSISFWCSRGSSRRRWRSNNDSNSSSSGSSNDSIIKNTLVYNITKM